MNDEELMNLIAKTWVEGGGDSTGFNWLSNKIEAKIKMRKLKAGDSVEVSSAVRGAPDEVFEVICGKKGNLILDDDIGTELSELNPQAVQKVEPEECSICHGQGFTTDHHDPCTECGGSGYYD